MLHSPWHRHSWTGSVTVRRRDSELSRRTLRSLRYTRHPGWRRRSARYWLSSWSSRGLSGCSLKDGEELLFLGIVGLGDHRQDGCNILHTVEVKELLHELRGTVRHRHRGLPDWRRKLWVGGITHRVHVAGIELHQLLHHQRGGADLCVLGSLGVDRCDSD